MNGKKFSDAMGEVDVKYVEEALYYKRDVKTWRRAKWGVLAACLILALSMGSAALAAAMGYDPLGWILAALHGSGRSAEQAVVQEELDGGEWVYLNGDDIAVILPGAPTKVLLSHDSGGTWRESVVEGSDKMFTYGQWREQVVPSGGFIGFWGEGGYLVLTGPTSMGDQPMRIYLTDDGGDTWFEIGNPYAAGEHYCVVTGAGFSCAEIGFISYRYYEDAGPDIWWTQDGGDTWQELVVELPEEYVEDGVFTPLSPTFDGPNGVYPIDADTPDGMQTLYLYSGDYGLTWEFRADRPHP